MPIVRSKEWLKYNNAIESDLKCAKKNIEIILDDLREHGETHIDYVLEKLSVSNEILSKICRLCGKNEEK